MVSRSRGPESVRGIHKEPTLEKNPFYMPTIKEPEGRILHEGIGVYSKKPSFLGIVDEKGDKGKK